MISVIIPTYNRASLLPRAIESVLGQTFQDFELIVVDDGSIDNTEAVMEEYMRKDDRIQYIRQSNSGGAAKPKNVGIRKAKGEYIAVLDSDDEWLPPKLESQVRFLENPKNKEVSAVGCNILIVNSTTKQESRYRIPRFKDSLRQLLMRDYMGPGSCMLYRKDVFDSVGFFDEQLKTGQDRDMRIRIAERYIIDVLDEYLVRYYIGHINVSAGSGVKNLERNWDYFFEKYKGYYLKNSHLWSEKLRYDGTRYILLGQTQKGRKQFFESMRKNPLNFKSIASLFISFFGQKAYGKIARVKMLIGSKLP